MLHIVDGNNQARRWLEMEREGSTLRSYVYYAQSLAPNAIFVWDGKGGNKRRRDIYPDYKRSRTPASAAMYASFDRIKELLKFVPVLQVEVPGYEADDVIASLIRGGVSNDVHIHTTDGDLAALGVPTDRRSAVCEPRWVRLYKTLVGDPSDNIPGKKGFGPKSWEKLSEEARITLERDFMYRKAEEPLQSYWDIIGFFDVPSDLISSHTSIGVNDPQAIEEVLRASWN